MFSTQLEEDIPATAQFTGGGATASCRCVQRRIGHTRRIRSKTDRRYECKSPIPESPPSPILDERGSRERVGSSGYGRHPGAGTVCRLHGPCP